MAATDLYLLCREYLEACEDALALAPGGSVSLVYVSPGLPALDCDQLTVHAGGPQEAATGPTTTVLQPGHRNLEPGIVPLIQMTATVARCVPTVDDQGNHPPAEAMDAAAQVTLADVWTIWNHVHVRHRDKLLFVRADGEPREAFFGAAVALDQSGGIGGWQIPILVHLPGYRTV